MKKDAVQIPVYSSIKKKDGKIVGKLEGFKEFPIELVEEKYLKH